MGSDKKEKSSCPARNCKASISGWFRSIPGEIRKPGMKTWQVVLNAFTFIMDCVYRLLVEFAKFVILVIVVIVSCQVFSRLILHSSIMWSEEVALLLMAWTAFISMAIGVEKKLHISITVFFNWFPRKVQVFFTKFNTVATIFFGYILIHFGILLTRNAMRSTLPATQWPAGVKYAIMPIAGIFIMYFAILGLFNLDGYRHPAIEGTGDEAKTDQQILEEMQEAKKNARKAVKAEGGEN